MEKSSLDQLKIDRKPEKEASSSKKVAFAIIGALFLAFPAWYFLKPEPLAEVETVTVSELKGQASGTILNASGYVTARRQATVSSKFTGRVTEVLIEEGMQVEAGQIMARLDDSNIKASFELVRAQLHSAQSGLKETEVLLLEARANLERTTNLVDRQLASDVELDRARALTDSLAAQLGRKKADVEVAARQVDVYRQQLEDTIVRAPFAGVVVTKNAQPGEMVSPISAGGGFTRTGIGTVVDMASLEIEIDVNEAYINRVTAGQKAVATLDAYPDLQIPCHVIAIIPTADRQRATVEVRVGFDEIDDRILPDMGVKVAFQEAASQTQQQRGVLVPRAAVREDGNTRYVYLLAAGVVERRAVSSSGERNGNIIITAGLSGGERVVVNAPAGLADGDRVKERD
jgi:RND family efflux transporter MFP subunit